MEVEVKGVKGEEEQAKQQGQFGGGENQEIAPSPFSPHYSAPLQVVGCPGLGGGTKKRKKK